MRFHLTSEWRLAAPRQAVWDLLGAAEDWPSWWPEIRRVCLLQPGAADDLGAVRRTWWTSRLPYGFVIDFTTRAARAPHVLEVDAAGDLRGTGRWVLQTTATGTLVRYHWRVEPAKAWMRWLAPLLAPLFVWNHHAVMRAGARGMARRLGVELLGYVRKGRP